jgi:hypothetical protein
MSRGLVFVLVVLIAGGVAAYLWPDQLERLTKLVSGGSEAPQSVAIAPESTFSIGQARNPGEQGLTYKKVIANIVAHEGRRVRWYGQNSGGSAKAVGGRYEVLATYFGSQAGSTVIDSQIAFAVKVHVTATAPAAALAQLPQRGVVNGTIQGWHDVSVTVGNKPTRMRIPVLVNVEFELDAPVAKPVESAGTSG